MALAEVEHFHPEEGMVLANTTSVGMKPNFDATPLAQVCFHLCIKLWKYTESERGILFFCVLQHALKHYCLVFDAIYTPKDTRLLREAKESGALVVYGTEMLIRQGFEQYKNFTGLPGKMNQSSMSKFMQFLIIKGYWY